MHSQPHKILHLCDARVLNSNILCALAPVQECEMDLGREQLLTLRKQRIVLSDSCCMHVFYEVCLLFCRKYIHFHELIDADDDDELILIISNIQMQ